MPPPQTARRVPLGALGLSLGALAVPVMAAFYFADPAGERSDLLWILALVPAFLLSFYRGWRAISVVLAVGMACLSLLVTVGPAIGIHIDDWYLYLIVVAPYTAIALGVGWFTDLNVTRRAGFDAIRVSEARFRALADASFEAVAIHEHGRILEANAGFATLFGYELPEVIGMQALDFSAPETREVVVGMMRSATEEPFEAVGKRKDGSTFIGEMRGKALPYQGRVVSVATVRDITERKRTEDHLRRQGTALDTMQLGVTMTDIQGVITYVNPADARMHGYTVAELVGQDIGIYSPGLRRPLAVSKLRSLATWRRESTNVRRDGGVFPVLLTSDVIRAADGEVTGVVTTCKDITDRKQAEGQLQRTSDNLRRSHVELELAQLQLIEAEKLESVGRLAAGVAHEVKNPLMTLLTGVKYLANRPGEKDPRITLLLDDMAEAVMRADTVIRGLLDFAAPRKLELQCQDLNPIVESSLKLMKHELDKAQITVVREFAAGLPPLMLDTFKIQQVMINLITNAVHATPPGGQITARTSHRPAGMTDRSAAGGEGASWTADEAAVFLQVEDTGSGIPAAAVAKIFDPFFTTKPTGSGTGLGLSVSRQIVQMHGGDLAIRNRGEGGVRATIVFKQFAVEQPNGQETHPAGR